MFDECYFIKIDEEMDTKDLEKFLSDSQISKINSNKSRFGPKIIGNLLKNLVICKKLHIPYQELKFSRTKFGKPFLEGFETFDFSLSHTHNAAVFAISRSNIGADIEKLRYVDLNIAKRFFCEQEQQRIFSCPDEKAQIRKFFEIWTKKEAYLKYLGVGLSKVLSSFDVYDVKPKIKTFEVKNFIISVCEGEQD